MVSLYYLQEEQGEDLRDWNLHEGMGYNLPSYQGQENYN